MPDEIPHIKTSEIQLQKVLERWLSSFIEEDGCDMKVEHWIYENLSDPLTVTAFIFQNAFRIAELVQRRNSVSIQVAAEKLEMQPLALAKCFDNTRTFKITNSGVYLLERQPDKMDILSLEFSSNPDDVGVKLMEWMLKRKHEVYTTLS